MSHPERITVSPAEPGDAAAFAELLEELYVAGAYRRRGVGELLMRSVFKATAARGCSRVEWTTDAGTTAARAFYARLDLPELPSKVFYRVDFGGRSGLGGRSGGS